MTSASSLPSNLVCTSSESVVVFGSLEARFPLSPSSFSDDFGDFLSPTLGESNSDLAGGEEGRAGEASAIARKRKLLRTRRDFTHFLVDEAWKWKRMSEKDEGRA